VTAPEPGIPEAVEGAVITALNEEAVVSTALGNKGGINIAVTYEAFGAKMHGAVRQEIIFADEQNAAGRPPGWLSVPLVLTSHAWENAKNERSHQDPILAEALLGEPSDVSRVFFVADHNTAAAVMEGVYATRGQIWTLVIAKATAIPNLFTPEEARQLLRDGGMRLPWAGHDPDHARIILTAIGGYQLVATLDASARLAERGVAHTVVSLLEPGRFRAPRSEREAVHMASSRLRAQLYPESVRPRLFLTHTRPEPMLGVLASLSTADRTVALGFVNQGATLDVEGMLFVNRATWAHAVDAAGRLLDVARDELLTADEQAALDHRRSPEGVITARRRA
jgi:phosphoketolase